MSRELISVQKSSDTVLGGNCNVVFRGVQEPIVKDGKQMKGAVRCHVVNMLRTAEIPDCVAIKR